MKILAIFPGLNPKYDDLAHAIQELVTLGHHVLVLAAQTSELKTKEIGALHEEVEGVSYYRPFLTVKKMVDEGLTLSGEIVENVKSFGPEVIFASSFRGLKVGKGLMRAGINAPIVMRVEHLDPIHAIYGRRRYLSIPWLGRLLGRVKWWTNAQYLSGVITTNAADLYADNRHLYLDGCIFYAPHCNQLPQLNETAPRREKKLMVYIGSLIRDKNCERWLKSVEPIFDKTPVENFLIIGDGPYRYVVDLLKKRYGNRIEHIASLPRTEALEKLRSGYFAYTEAQYGWGFIGDCWATATALLAPQSTYGLVKNIDALKPTTSDMMLADINRMYSDPQFHKDLALFGFKRYQNNHTAHVVARHYESAIKSVIDYARS